MLRPTAVEARFIWYARMPLLIVLMVDDPQGLDEAEGGSQPS